MLIGVIAGFASGNDPVYQNPQYNSSQDPYGIGYALGSFAVGINNAFAMTAGQKALVGGLGLGVSGALVGAVIGAIAHKKFIINGKKEKFDMMSESVLDKTYGKPANK